MKSFTVMLFLPSPFVRLAVETAIAKHSDIAVNLIMIDEEMDSWLGFDKIKPSMLICDASHTDRALIETARNEWNATVIGISTSIVSKTRTGLFDEVIDIYSPTGLIPEAIKRLEKPLKQKEPVKELSPREKEVVIGIVKGLSNKEIASRINVSVNTVMTHRRNIASKLQIHSPAGLTIYAIVSNLVTLDEAREANVTTADRFD